MTKLKILGTAVVLASAMASPTLAQDVVYNRGYCPSYPNANCQITGSGNPHAGSYYRRRMAYHDNRYADTNAGWNNGWRDDRSWNEDLYRGSGFWRAAAAVGVVGGGIGTAGAIAPAPSRAHSQPIKMLRFGSGENLVLNLFRPGVARLESERQRHVPRAAFPECDTGNFHHLVDMVKAELIFYLQAQYDFAIRIQGPHVRFLLILRRGNPPDFGCR